MKRFIVGSLTALAVAIGSSCAFAITHTWQGGNFFDNDGMALAANWSGGVPVDGSSALTLNFPFTANNFAPDQNITGVLNVQHMGFAGNYTMIGNAYALENLGANPTMASNGNVQFNVPVTLLDPTTANVIGNLFFSNSFSSSSSLSFTSPTSGVVNFGGGSPNSVFGTLTANSNVQVQFAKTFGLATQGDVLITGTNAYVTATQPNQFGALSSVTAQNGGTFQLSGTAPQTILNLTLQNGGQVALNSNTLTVTGSINANIGPTAIGGSSGTFNLNGGAKTITVATAGPTNALTINAAVSNGTINKVGAGTLELTNSLNSFSGQNVVTAGLLRGAADTIGSDVLNNSTVALTGGIFSTPVISGPGNVSIQGNVTYNAAQTYGGGTSIETSLDTLSGNASTLSGNFTSSGFGQLRFNQATAGTFSGSLSGNLRLFIEGAGALTIGGVNTHSAVTDLAGGSVRVTTDTALGTGPLQIINGSNPNTIEAVGTRTFSNQLIIASNFSVVGGGNLAFTDNSAKILGTVLTHNSTGNTTIAGKFTVNPFGSVVVNNGALALGNVALVNGFVSNGPIVVNGGTLTVNSFNFTTLPDVTLAGGTLNAPNGYAIPLGATLQGLGGVTGRVATANGSSVYANGNLAIGDAFHVAGVNFDGELYTNNNTVTLLDANQAVLGSLTDIGTPTLNGTLAASNGYVLNFGRNIVGRGQIQSTNTLADAAIINGDVNGDSFTNYLEFTGYVKGVGTFNNVAFSGTFSPGLSPTLMTVGNTLLLPSNVLDIEIGGLSRGGQYDAFDITNGSTMQLDGELQVSLFNAFSPALGDQFLLFQGIGTGAFGGTFDTYDFPALNPGLSWDISLLYSNGILRVVAAVPEPTSVLPLTLFALVLARRRRSNV